MATNTTVKATKGIPSVPDVPPQLDIEGVYRILEPLTRIINIRQGKFDPLDRWVTQQDLVDAGLQTEGAVSSPVPVVPPTSVYDFALSGDILGTATAMATGSPLITMPTIINLPNVVCIDGGDAAETYPGETTGPYGVVSGGGGGDPATGWVKIEEVTVTATSEIDITWDESLYHAIRVEANAMTLDTDSKRVELYLGSADGATIYDTTGDYVMFYTNLIAANVWATNNTSTHVLMMTSSVGNAAGEVVSFTIELTHFGGVNQGAFIETNANWIATNGSQIAQKTFASMFGQEAVVDTIRLRAETGAFGTDGTLSVYGLLK